MALSVHDNNLISYEVQSEARTIMLRTEYRMKNEPTEFTNVIFKGVQGYCFDNDAFGNIIFGLETVTVEKLLAEYGTKISESYRMAGSPGPWAANLETVSRLLREQRDRRNSYSVFVIWFVWLGSRSRSFHFP